MTSPTSSATTSTASPSTWRSQARWAWANGMRRRSICVGGISNVLKYKFIKSSWHWWGGYVESRTRLSGADEGVHPTNTYVTNFQLGTLLNLAEENVHKTVKFMR